MGEHATKTEAVKPYRRALEGLLGVPATEGNHIDVLRNGDEIFPALFDAIRSAERTIDFLTFVYWEGRTGEEVADALADRAREGVRVRVLLDALGTPTMDRRLIQQMEDAGCLVERFRPLRKISIGENDHRTHRKVLICDEDAAFTGGVGIADEWRGGAEGPDEWRDTHFRVRGPAVDGLRAAFLQNWAETEHQLFDDGVDRFPEQPQDGPSVVQVIRGESVARWSDITTLIRSLLCLAKERVRITTAYFVPDEGTCDLLRQAAEGGVSVEVLVPGPHVDKRFVQVAAEAQFAGLLEAGVKLWSYQPTMLHAKVMTVDGVVANVGSANFDSRSLTLDDEVNLVVLDPDVVAERDRHFDEDVARSKPIRLGPWDDRPLVQRAKEKVISLVDEHF
ncbi:MAG: phospholipase D-like domain-containing protein [Acidimicrobiales bacterium]